MMDDFKSQLAAAIEDLQAQGKEPLFLAVDLNGIDQIKREHSADAARRFRQAAIDAINWTAHAYGCFTYGEVCVIAVIPGLGRLRTFAVIEKLRRSLPLLAQSYDCSMQPSFDVLGYEEADGVAGLIKQLISRGDTAARSVA